MVERSKFDPGMALGIFVFVMLVVLPACALGVAIGAAFGSLGGFWGRWIGGGICALMALAAVGSTML